MSNNAKLLLTKPNGKANEQCKATHHHKNVDAIILHQH
jgi:hypothetical protein